MLTLLGRGRDASQGAAANVMAFETALAKASRKLEDLRDPQKNYNKMAPADVTAKHTPSIVWTDRLAAWNLHPASVIVGQPEFFTALERCSRRRRSRCSRTTSASTSCRSTRSR